MGHYLKTRHYLLLGLAFAIGFIYSFPSWQAHFLEGSAFFINWDESWYVTRVIRALNGEFWVGSPFIFDDRGDLPIVPALAESIIGGLGLLWNKLFFWLFEIDNSTLLCVIRFIGPFLTTMAIYLGLSCLRLPTSLSFLILSIIMLEPALYYLKPWWLTGKEIMEMPFNRAINPILNIALFFGSWSTVVWAFYQSHNKKLGGALAGVALATLFYTSLYYWSHLILIIVLMVLFLKIEEKWQVFIYGVLAAFVCGLPYLALQFQIQEYPAYADFSWRHGMFFKGSTPWILGHKFFWVTLFFTCALFFIKNKRVRVLIISGVSGSLLYFIPVLFNFDFQTWHYKHTAFPFLWMGTLTFLYSIVEQKMRWSLKRPMLVLIPLYLCVLIFGSVKTLSNQYDVETRKKQFPQQGVGKLSQEQKEVLRFIAEKTEKNSVIMAEINLMPVVPLHTNRWVWLDNHMTSDLMTSHEIFYRYALYWKVMGYTEKETREMMFSPSKDNLVPIWFYGIPNELREGELTPLGLEGQKKFSQSFSKLYEILTNDKVLEIAKDNKLDYIVLKAKDTLSLFTGEKVFENSVYKIIQVNQ